MLLREWRILGYALFGIPDQKITFGTHRLR